MDYDKAKASTRKLDNINLSWYDEAQNKWNPEKHGAGNTGSIELRVVRMGRYMIIGRRN
jgi:hypothetical protein